MMKQRITVLLLVLFYFIYFGKKYLQKKQGIVTNQLKEQKKGKEKVLGMLISLVSVGIALIQLLSLYFHTTIFPEWIRTIGIFLVGASDVIFFLAIYSMGDSWRAGVSRTQNTELVTKGIYRFSRNPAFLAFDLSYIGVLLVCFNWILLVITVAAILVFHLQIIWVEEPFLTERFGSEYQQYKKKVKRY